MTNEQYSNMMVAFAKLEAKIDSLEREIKLLSKPVELKVDFGKPVPLESFSRFLNFDNLKAETTTIFQKSEDFRK